MRIGKLWSLATLAAAAIVLAVLAFPTDFSRLLAYGSSGDRSVFYRLIASYQYAHELVDFDIVVGCAVRVISYGDGGSSYDAFRDPVVYARPLRDGSALMQIVPDACRGETTDNGRVPDDFLPGVVWFERADNLSLGIAYVTEDAFESSRSKLKFLGATIQAASQEDWEAFRPTAAQNLIDPRPFTWILPPPPADEMRTSLGDSKALARLFPGMTCHAVGRIHLARENTRSVVRGYWPESRPRYWSPTPQQFDALLNRFNLFGDADDDRSTSYLILGQHTADGFPTRDGGGAIGSAHKEWDTRPPTIFPLRRDEGAPWITSDALTASTLFRYVELTAESRGFAYCYKNIEIDRLRDASAGPMTLTTRVNGEAIHGEDTDSRQPGGRSAPFFERDEYLYYSEEFGLN